MFKENEIQAIIAQKLRSFRQIDAPDDVIAKMLAQYVFGLTNMAANVEGFASFLSGATNVTYQECYKYVKQIKKDGGSHNLPKDIKKMWDIYLQFKEATKE